MGVKIQIVDSREADYTQLIHFFAENGHQVSCASSWIKGLKQFKREKPDMVFLSLGLPDLSAVEASHKIQKNGHDVDLFVLVDSPEQGIEALRHGAAYYFVRPCNVEEVKIVTSRFLAARSYRARVEQLRRWYLQRLESDDVVAVSRTMQDLYQQAVKTVESCTHPLLLVGEIGTGKELLAQILHLKSPHFMSPFISLCCKEINSSQLDEYLVITPPGGRQGETAGVKNHDLDRCTLFLSHVEHLSKADQAKLLKSLKGRRAAAGKKAGGFPWGRCVVVATDENLKKLVDTGTFNKELYHLLSRRTVHIPPLRKRPGEIITLALHFMEVFNRIYDKQVKKIDPEVKQYLEAAEWIGNVSELKNVMEHCVITTPSDRITMQELAFKGNKQVMSLDTLLLNGSFLSLDELVALYVKTVLKKVKGNKSKAAKLLRVSRNTLKKKSVVI